MSRHRQALRGVRRPRLRRHAHPAVERAYYERQWTAALAAAPHAVSVASSCPEQGPSEFGQVHWRRAGKAPRHPRQMAPQAALRSQAPARLGQSAACTALAGHIGLVFCAGHELQRVGRRHTDRARAAAHQQRGCALRRLRTRRRRRVHAADARLGGARETPLPGTDQQRCRARGALHWRPRRAVTACSDW